MKRCFFLMVIFLLTLNHTISQDKIKGSVKEYHEAHQMFHGLPGANVFWAGTTKGTTTDKMGEFTIKKVSGKKRLVISFVGYKNDTVEIEEGQKEITIVLSKGEELDEVMVEKRLGGAYISTVEPIKTEVITEKGLQQLACCNLAESFENNATVDVSYSDAVSGARQIRMLGLAGVYSQIMMENLPLIRGLSTTYGLNYIPGSWMESIQISKGAASVINGYESTTGQINLEIKKPDNSEPLYADIFQNSLGRSEVNALSAINLNENWSTMLLVHGSRFDNIIDVNNDGFLDMPLNEQLNLMNRWKYKSENMESQFGFKYLSEERNGGQVLFVEPLSIDTSLRYGIGIETNEYMFFGKTGFMFERPSTSLGIQAKYNRYERNSFFGINQYDGYQNSIYSNIIYQSYIGNTNHTYKVGGSYIYDWFEEEINDSLMIREEHVPGIFGEYTYSFPEKFKLIAALRADQNSYYGTLITPRLHIKYNVTNDFIVRGSAGKGYRSANILAENQVVLASSRRLMIDEPLDIEEAWNMGVNISNSFDLSENKALSFTIDYYHTAFENKIVVDLDDNPQEVHFYNLKGRSYSNSFQAGVTINPVKRFDISAAYRLNDVQTTINDELRQQPLVNKHKGLLTLSYATHHEKWRFDMNNQYNGQSRLPNTSDNPQQYQKEGFSTDFFMIHAQITKKIKSFEIYVGGENLTDFRQDNPIIAADEPFGEYFDASMVWGPLIGRRVYGGIRFKIN